MDNLTMSIDALNNTIIAYHSFYAGWYSFFLGVLVGLLGLHGLIKYA